MSPGAPGVRFENFDRSGDVAFLTGHQTRRFWGTGSDSTQLQRQQLLQRFDQQEGAPWSQQQLGQPAPPCPRPASRHEEGHPAHRWQQLRAVDMLCWWQGVRHTHMHHSWPAQCTPALKEHKKESIRSWRKNLHCRKEPGMSIPKRTKLFKEQKMLAMMESRSQDKPILKIIQL
eukprot:1139484-Pelagomonas_calceolata.AAC.3